MIEGIIGKKLGMTQVYDDKGKIEAVTAIEVGPCTVVQIKKTAKEGYDAVKLGYGQVKQRKTAVQEAAAETTKESPKESFRYLREFRVDKTDDVKNGDKVDVTLFEKGTLVDIVGTSKGKGNAGVVKKYHFRGGPKTQGQSDRTRHPGAIGSTTSPGHVWKGLRMAGRMGGARVTIKGLEIISTNPERNLLVVKGAVPGNRNDILLVKKSKGKK
jgi:large subunit ribosomal protein L3